MKRRNWSVEEKEAIVLEGLSRGSSVAEICREHQISQTLYYRWRDKFLDGGRKGLAKRGGDDEAYRKEIVHLQRIIGKQAVQLDILKKSEALLGGR